MRPIQAPWNVFESGAEHILYDTVHIVGEIKTSYTRGRDGSTISSFANVLRNVKTNLKRDQSSIQHKLGFQLDGSLQFSGGQPDPYHNPLFSFMIIADSGKFSFDEVIECYSETPLNMLPNVVCLLDRGCILHVNINIGPNKDVSVRGINIIPEFDVEHAVAADHVSGSGWTLFRPTDTARAAGTNLALLHAMMMKFLRRTFLKPSDISTSIFSNLGYTGRMITYNPTGS